VKEAIVSDSSSLIMLAKLGKPELLTNLYKRLIIPERVIQEIIAKESMLVNQFLDQLPVVPGPVGNAETLVLLDNILDPGEAEAIAVAQSMQLPLLIDEKKGRKIALNLGLKVIGLLGVIILNKRLGFIGHDVAIDYFQQAKACGFRVSGKLETDSLRLVSVG